MSAPPETGPAPLDIEIPNHLLRWLEEQELAAPGEKIETSVLVGGVSNRTVRVQAGGSDLIVKQALSKLRVEDEWFSPTDRILTEFAALGVYGSFFAGSGAGADSTGPGTQHHRDGRGAGTPCELEDTPSAGNR